MKKEETKTNKRQCPLINSTRSAKSVRYSGRRKLKVAW